MKNFGRCTFATLLLSTVLSTSVLANTETNVASLNKLEVATWNVEHLAFPINQGCRPRDTREFNELKDYANSLTADIIAFQEVSSYEAVENLFPSSDWQIFVSQRADTKSYDCRQSGFKSTQQKVAFAVRKALNVKQITTLDEFGIDNPGLRHGLELTVESSLGDITILNVHMKSGCFVDDFTKKDSRACKTLAKQVPVLDGWIEKKEKQGTPYIVLGDFNHRLSSKNNYLADILKNNSDNSVSTMQLTTQDSVGCHPRYPAPIDHIILGNVDPSSVNKKVVVYPYKNMDPEAMLSDHCAVSLSITPVK